MWERGNTGGGTEHQSTKPAFVLVDGLPAKPLPAQVEPPSPAYWEASPSGEQCQGPVADLASREPDLIRFEELARSFVGLADLRRNVSETQSALLGRILLQGVQQRLETLSHFLVDELRGGDAGSARSSDLQHALFIIEWMLETAAEAESSPDLRSFDRSLDALRALLAASPGRVL